MGTQSQARYPTRSVSRGEQAGGAVNLAPQLSRARRAATEKLLLPIGGRAVPCLLPANISDLLPSSAPAMLHLELPGAAALLFNKFPVSKKKYTKPSSLKSTTWKHQKGKKKTK